MSTPDIALDVLTKMWPGAERASWSAFPRPLSRSLTYALLPRPSRATLLVPISPRAVTAATLRNYKAASTAAARTRGRILELGGLLGLGRMLPGTLSISSAGSSVSLVEHVSELLGVEVQAGIALGPPRANRKPVLQLITPQGRTVAFGKVGINDLTRARVRSEAEALGVVSAARVNGVIVPDVLAHFTWGECEVLLLAPVQTWSVSARADEVRSNAMVSLSLVGERGTAPLRALSWWRRLGNGLEELRGGDADTLREHWRAVNAFAMDRRLAYGAAHGDWTPWNISVNDDQAVVWDWERFATDCPVGIDALHYVFQNAVRRRGERPYDALISLYERSASVVEKNGAKRADGTLLVALYLLHLGERYIRDRQQEAGERKGPLGTWLLPALAVVARRLADAEIRRGDHEAI